MSMLAKRFSLKKILTHKSLTIFFGSVWLLTIILFLSFLAITTKFFQVKAEEGPLQGEVWTNIFILDILVGVVAFIIFAGLLTALAMRRNEKKKRSFLIKIRDFLLFFVYLGILPIYLLARIWKPKELFTLIKRRVKIAKKEIAKSVGKNLALSFLVVFILFPVWVLGYFTVGVITADSLGLMAFQMDIVGTGSMYPTFPKGEGKDPKELAQQVVSTQGMFRYPNGLNVFGKRYFGHTLGRGDIITVEDDKTRKSTEETYGTPSGWLKRVIALSGDRLEIRDGILYLNGEPQKETYTAKPRSTFGQSFLKECQEVTVPENSVFVMGDNRKGSRDSRDVGFFSVNDIRSALPYEKQLKTLSKNWHDASGDLDESSRTKLNKDEYLEALNAKRLEEGLKPLKYQAKLEDSARLRGESMLKYNDFSFEATVSGYTMEDSMREAKYSNTFWGEAPTSGYYEAQELLDNQLEFPESKKFVFDKRFQEVGIAEVLGEVNGCPTHVIVQHFGGYIPPNYKAEDITSWEEALESLKSVQPSWSALKNDGAFYSENRGKVDRINQIIDLRINKITDIVGTMKANKWFSSAQTEFIERGDRELYLEAENLASQLNSL